MRLRTEPTDEWVALRDLFTAYLNKLGEEIGYDPLPEQYYYDYVLHADVVFYGMYRYLLIELLSDDDGGSSMLMIHTDAHDIGNIEFASHTFDSTTVVWKGPQEANDYRLTERG